MPKSPKVRSAREQGEVLAKHGAYLQLDPRVHRAKRIPNKKKEAARRACR